MDTENKGRNKRVLIITVILIAVVVFFVYITKFQKTRVPNEFILTNDKESVEKIHQDFNDLDFARYTIEKPTKETYDYFLNKLQTDGWEIVSKSQTIIFAQKGNRRVNIYVSETSPTQSKVEVTLIPD